MAQKIYEEKITVPDAEPVGDIALTGTAGLTKQADAECYNIDEILPLNPEPKADCGSALAVAVIIDNWQKLGLISEKLPVKAIKIIWSRATNFIASFPMAGVEALEIGLKPHFDALIGKLDPHQFTRRMAANIILHLTLIYSAAEEHENKRLEADTDQSRVNYLCNQDDVNYTPESDSDFSDLAYGK